MKFSSLLAGVLLLSTLGSPCEAGLCHLFSCLFKHHHRTCGAPLTCGISVCGAPGCGIPHCGRSCGYSSCGGDFSFPSCGISSGCGMPLGCGGPGFGMSSCGVPFAMGTGVYSQDPANYSYAHAHRANRVIVGNSQDLSIPFVNSPFPQLAQGSGNMATKSDLALTISQDTQSNHPTLSQHKLESFKPSETVPPKTFNPALISSPTVQVAGTEKVQPQPQSIQPQPNPAIQHLGRMSGRLVW